MRIVVIDTETGGIDPLKHSLLSLAAVLVEDTTIIDAKQWFVLEDPLIITKGAWDTNHIELKEFYQRAIPPREVCKEFTKFTSAYKVEKGRIIPGGHNVSFDLSFIKRLAKIADDSYFSNLFTYHSLDTHAIMRFLHITGTIPEMLTSLSHCCEYFGIEIGNAHTALDDAVATAKLIIKSTELIKSTSTQTQSSSNDQHPDEKQQQTSQEQPLFD